MGAFEEHPFALVVGIIGVLVAFVYFLVDIYLGNAFSGLFELFAENADTEGFSTVGSIIRVIPLILFVGVPTAVIAKALKLIE